MGGEAVIADLSRDSILLSQWEIGVAGSILISLNCGVALNSVGYHWIVAAVRAQLNSEGELATKSVFEPNDLEGMTFISLIEADQGIFRSFQRAAVAAYAAATKAGQTFEEWDELMRKLRDDPRSEPT